MPAVPPTRQNLLDLGVVVISLISLGPDDFPASVIRSLRAFRVRAFVARPTGGASDSAAH